MPLPGQPQDTPIPPHLNRWNWGAFLLNWIWGLGNSTDIALLMFVPLVNFIFIFFLGAKGSKWAWKNRIWADEEHFVRTQRNWARAGVAVFLAFILFGAAVFYGVTALMKGTDAYKISMKQVKASPEVVAALGQPISAGWVVTGNTRLSGSSGTADLSIPISGPKGEGRVLSQATKVGGTWIIHLLVVRIDGVAKPIILINERNIQIPNAAVDT